MIAVRKFMLSGAVLSGAVLSGAVLAFSLSAAVAGPCNTTANKDAGSGKVPGYTGQIARQSAPSEQTTGQAMPTEKEHAPTAAMNKAAENTATSSQDTQRQMQGQPTAAQKSEHDKMAAMPDKGC